MTNFSVDEDLVSLIWERAKPKPFENLTFSQALRRVLIDATDKSNNPDRPLLQPTANELLAAVASMNEDQLEGLSQKIKETRSQRAASPSPEVWASKIPALRGKSHIRSWKHLCDHFGIQVDGDSGRRKLQNWVKKNHPEWPPVPDVTA